jgi:uncharacterized protein (UPF0212 family)
MKGFTKCPKCVEKLVMAYLKIDGSSRVCPICESVY